MSDQPIQVNRAPVLTLWATVVAERLGHSPETALTLAPLHQRVASPSYSRRCAQDLTQVIPVADMQFRSRICRASQATWGSSQSPGIVTSLCCDRYFYDDPAKPLNGVCLVRGPFYVSAL
jgi:hypothetical protein